MGMYPIGTMGLHSLPELGGDTTRVEKAYVVIGSCNHCLDSRSEARNQTFHPRLNKGSAVHYTTICSVSMCSTQLLHQERVLAARLHGTEIILLLVCLLARRSKVSASRLGRRRDGGAG